MDTPQILSNLPELHAHIGSSIAPHIYWHIANSEGYKLPQRDYHEFVDHIVLSPTRKMSLKQYLDEIYHPILDRLSAGAIALEKAVYETFSGAYRSGITVYELRGNPMKHNREGEVDLDHAIMAMLRGMERALLEYPKLRAGIIFCLDRQFPFEKNKIIVEKAIKYHRRGVIGIDFGNYVFKGHNPFNFQIKDYTEIVERARKAGLKVTVHAGEAYDADNDMWDCIEYLHPDRIGHGIQAASDKKLMDELVKRKIVLEVCPVGNLMTKAIKDDAELKHILQTFYETGVKFTINSDWPETIQNGHLKQQYEYVMSRDMLNEQQIQNIIDCGFASTFIPMKAHESNLYL